MRRKDTKKECRGALNIRKRTLSKPRELMLERLPSNTMAGRASFEKVTHIFVIDPEVVEPNKKGISK